MKKLVIILVMVCGFTQAKAQNYKISFAGRGAASTVDSILVKNLTSGKSISLGGSDTLLLFKTLGIEQDIMVAKQTLRVYPNPVASNGIIEFYAPEAGQVTVELYTISGKKVASTQNKLPAGLHTFLSGGLPSGLYMVYIKSENQMNSGKVISIGQASGSATITYQGSQFKSTETSKLKSASNLVPMQYNSRERLLIKATSGIYSTVSTLIPTGDTTVTSAFFEATDADGNNYATVTIGGQTWLAENLKTTKYSDGTDIPYITNTQSWIQAGVAYCWFNNDIANKDIYGGMYKWKTLDFASNGGKSVAPEGWHVATDADWTVLSTYLGGENVAGKKLKETGTKHWLRPNTGATNEVGFTSLPSGSRDNADGLFFLLGVNNVYWTADQFNETNAWYRYMSNTTINLERFHYHKGDGFAVRCVKN